MSCVVIHGQPVELLPKPIYLLGMYSPWNVFHYMYACVIAGM